MKTFFSSFRFATALACVALACAPALAQDALTEFRAYTKDLSSLAGSFTQEVRDKNGKVSRNSVGTFTVMRPGKFRFVYEKPYKQTIVSDGTTVWLHDEDLNQVTVRKLGDSLSEQPLALLLDPQASEKLFDIKNAPPQGSIRYVSATAKKADAAVNELAVALVEGQPTEIVWRDAWQNVNTLRFSALARNAKVEASQFQFTPPKGADILKQ
ncbi:MAG: outer membrane lipoprotein chaperone LolA [Casimicrobium sp.]